jgi:hypothetical protein
MADTRLKGKDTRGTAYTQYSSGVRVGAPTRPTATPGKPILGPPVPANHYQNLLKLIAAQNNSAQNGMNLGDYTGLRNGGGSGSSGGGGGRAAGPNPAQVQAIANQAYAFNAQPYDLMRQQVGNQRTQAQGYNPDFAGMQNTYNQGLQGIDQARAQAVTQRLQELVGFGQQLGQQQTSQMRGALGDLAAQGAAPGRYLDQASQMAGDRTAMLANQGQYLGQLNASAANQMAQDQSLGGLIRQGGEANLANNRGTLMNQLAQQEAQIGLHQAQAQQQNDQARREFLLKYGVT